MERVRKLPISGPLERGSARSCTFVYVRLSRRRFAPRRGIGACIRKQAISGTQGSELRVCSDRWHRCESWPGTPCSWAEAPECPNGKVRALRISASLGLKQAAMTTRLRSVVSCCGRGLQKACELASAMRR